MRNEKFDNSKSAFNTDDIKYAFDCNGLAAHLDNIDVIVAEVCGANDEYDWHWLLQMKDGTFRYAHGGCDYTGWDCQSSAYISEPVPTVEDALGLTPVIERYCTRKIRENLARQLSGDQAFATYVV
jgi:hypothetical protein